MSKLVVVWLIAGLMVIDMPVSVMAGDFDPSYENFMNKKAYTIPTKPGMGPAGYTVSTFSDKNNQSGAVFLGSVGAKPPTPDLADPRFNFVPERDYGQGAGVNLRVSF